MRVLFIVTLMAGLIAISPLLAQDTAATRFTMTPTDAGMLRLDTQTGALSHCTLEDEGWVCKSVADDRLALENEIDRLSNENRELRERLSLRRPDAVPDEEQESLHQTAPELPNAWLPDDAHIEEFMSFFEKIMRRFKQMADSMKSDSASEQP